MSALSISLGKQLPPSIATKSQHQPQNVTDPPVSWSMRDAANQLVENRHQLLAAAQGNSGSDSAATAVEAYASALIQEEQDDNSKTQMWLSATFDIESTLGRLRREKGHVVQQAFDAAATAILAAVGNRRNTGTGLDESSSTRTLQRIGPLEILEQAEALRVEALERAHENKEILKRTKGGAGSATKVEGEDQGTVSSGSHVAKPGEKKKRKALPINSSSTISPSLDATAAAQPVPKPNATTSLAGISVPKFTRNTPASSAAALDFRFNSSRAILCAAGNIVFDALTPDYPGHEIETRNIPQNPGKRSSADPESNTSGETATEASNTNAVNMGAVVVEAQTLGQRTISVVENAVRRSTLRYKYRKDNARYDQDPDEKDFLRVENIFSWKTKKRAKRLLDGGATEGGAEETEEEEEEDGDDEPIEDDSIPYQPNSDAITYSWQTSCLPRMLSVMKTGAGHAVYHDVQWSTRHGRIADLLRALSTNESVAAEEDPSGKSIDGNFGPHLIVTTEPEMVLYAQEFYDLRSNLRLVTTNESNALNVLVYQGSKSQRRKLRKFFPQATGLPESPFHVLVTSYAYLFEDYLHFCQIPFETVILDEGVAVMSMAHGDQNSAAGKIWEYGMFSSNDQQIGLAGTSLKEWDFSKDKFSEATLKDSWIGLTTRHRIITGSAFSTRLRASVELAPVSALVTFLAPHFAKIAREEWDRSRIGADIASMKHFRHLVARSTVVHHSMCSDSDDLSTLAMKALTGNLMGPQERGVQTPAVPMVPEVIPDDAFVFSGKIAYARRSSLFWLGNPNHSWLRYELAGADFQPILHAMKISNNHGHFCEEITTASSTTSSGATGQVAGTMAYRLAVRCGRHFGSEQGLRQHLSALHAPPGTWLCRTCGSDCITSQARTHHERSCGQPACGTIDRENSGSVGATPTVGQGASNKGGVGKKKARTGAAPQGNTATGEKDPDGSFRVPSYRGVWVNTVGKHFVKINGHRLTEKKGEDANSEEVIYFDNIDDAARKHDEVLRNQTQKGQKQEFNFKSDGSRVVYEDITATSTTGLGGSAANVVPALSVINIKDLPPDVKPLLRDPRQTSRTGGNSKRHIYAYRGVCRQARKGHDRWQSQISFMGVNHYLGTFDSEWDAAAIYAWAHLILYGEEATRQAQKEGEEAAAAYEKEKRDIAAGKIPEPPPKPEKKKKKPNKKNSSDQAEDGEGGTGASGTGENGNEDSKESGDPAKKRKAKDDSIGEKKVKLTIRTAKYDKEAIGPTLAKGVAKAPILGPRDHYEAMTDEDLLVSVAQRIVIARDIGYSFWDASTSPSPAAEWMRPCVALSASIPQIVGGAMLLGLSPKQFAWDLEEFMEQRQQSLSEADLMTALQLAAVEYDEDGVNEKFKTIVQGTLCVLGSASERTQRMYKALGLGTVPLGSGVGKLDCHVGGVPGSCSENAACIRHEVTDSAEFHVSCLSDDDIVTLNGKRIQPESGSLPLMHEDICTVGARVFAFLLPSEK